MTKAGSTTLTVRVDGRDAFEVFFDGSDNKISIKKLRVSECTTHASWTLS